MSITTKTKSETHHITKRNLLEKNYEQTILTNQFVSTNRMTYYKSPNEMFPEKTRNHT